MTRQIKITNMEAEGSERTILATLVSAPNSPMVIMPGREVVLAVYDAMPAIILSKAMLKDIEVRGLDYGQFNVLPSQDAVIVDGAKTSAQYEQEIEGLKADNERLQSEIDRLTPPPLTDAEAALLQDIGAPADAPTIPEVIAEARAAEVAAQGAIEASEMLADANDLPFERPPAPSNDPSPAPVDPEPVVDLTDMTKAELVEHAEAHDIEIDPKAKKADIVDAIEAAGAETKI